MRIALKTDRLNHLSQMSLSGVVHRHHDRDERSPRELRDVGTNGVTISIIQRVADAHPLSIGIRANRHRCRQSLTKAPGKLDACNQPAGVEHAACKTASSGKALKSPTQGASCTPNRAAFDRGGPKRIRGGSCLRQRGVMRGQPGRLGKALRPAFPPHDTIVGGASNRIDRGLRFGVGLLNLHSHFMTSLLDLHSRLSAYLLHLRPSLSMRLLDLHSRLSAYLLHLRLSLSTRLLDLRSCLLGAGNRRINLMPGLSFEERVPCCNGPSLA